MLAIRILINQTTLHGSAVSRLVPEPIKANQKNPRKLCSGFPPGTPVSTGTIKLGRTVRLIFLEEDVGNPTKKRA